LKDFERNGNHVSNGQIIILRLNKPKIRLQNPVADGFLKRNVEPLFAFAKVGELNRKNLANLNNLPAEARSASQKR
jgi:hypothetical protein